MGCAFSADGQALISSDGRTVRLWDGQTGAELVSLQLWTCRMSPDGMRMALGSLEALTLWDGSAQAHVCEWRGVPNILAWSPEGKRLVVATQSGAIVLLRLENLAVGPVLAALWRSPLDGRGAFGCPLCQAWSETDAATPGAAISCPNCGGDIRLSPFTVNGDWRPIAEAWGKEI
jgi:WD40 repeat protein